MAVPKRKVSKSRRDMRRSHNAIEFRPALVKCEKCGEWKERHRICKACGTYRGRQVFEIQQA
jgi:large subunit ribosomal protein L32